MIDEYKKRYANHIAEANSQGNFDTPKIIANAIRLSRVATPKDFADFKEAFKDYHINGLHYSNSEKFATIPNGDVGGAGEKIDKVYNIAWISKDEWLIKRNEVKSLYTS